MVQKNRWFLRRVQCLFAIFYFSLIIYSLSRFRYYSSLHMRRSQKLFYCVIWDRVIAVLIFFFKLSIGFDPYVNMQWRNGAFDNSSNEILVYVWATVGLNVWIVFFFVPGTFLFQLILICMLVLLQMWAILGHRLRNDIQKERDESTKRLLCGHTKPLNAHEKTCLQSLGFRVTNKVIDFGTCGTTYECGFCAKTENNLALKVIDITEWVENRTPNSSFPAENRQKVDEIRREYLQVVRKLRALDNKNVVRFEKVHNEAGTFHRIYMITRLAEMNLDTFLTHYKPDGVSEEWARNWFDQLCKGLLYLHEVFDSEPFPHSNIKPENILLYPKKESHLENDSDPNTHRFHFGRRDKSSDSSKSKSLGTDMRDRFVLKLTDCGFNAFMPLGGKVLTKRNHPIMISPPKKVVGKRYLRILNEKNRPNERKFDDIYQMGVILILLLKGDINRLIKAPVDTARIHNEVTGVDAFYVRFDKPAIIQKLLAGKPYELKLLLKKMMEWEPLLRYDITQVIASDWMKENL